MKYASKTHYLKYKYSGGREMKRAQLECNDIKCSAITSKMDVVKEGCVPSGHPNFSNSGKTEQHPLTSAHATKEYYQLRYRKPRFMNDSLTRNEKDIIAENLFGIEASEKTKKKGECALLAESKRRGALNEGCSNLNTCKTYCDRYDFLRNLN